VQQAPLLDRLILVDTPFAVPMRPEVARLRHAEGHLECPLIGQTGAHGQNGAFDPYATSVRRPNIRFAPILLKDSLQVDE
jgi:hypothetical protein